MDFKTQTEARILTEQGRKAGKQRVSLGSLGQGRSSKRRRAFIRDKAESLIQRLAQGGTIKELAAHCGVSPATFVRHLKPMVGEASWKHLVHCGPRKGPFFGNRPEQTKASDSEAQQAIDALTHGSRKIRQCYGCAYEMAEDVTRCPKCGSREFETVILRMI